MSKTDHPNVIFIIAFVLARLYEIPLNQAVILTDGNSLEMVHLPSPWNCPDHWLPNSLTTTEYVICGSLS